MEKKIDKTKAVREKITGKTITLDEKKTEAKETKADEKKEDEKDKKKDEVKEAVVVEATAEVVTEAKDEKESPKDKKVEKAVMKAGDVAPANVEKTAAGMIPPSAIQTIQAFMDETLNDITLGVAELQAMRIDANTIDGGENYYEKAEELQDEIKQIARMAKFVKNNTIAQKFETNLLNMIDSVLD